ncbi:hypothetical protein ABIE09_000070 [Lysobacter enzymogenes]|uniref:hypothetical protein n=1 Tax=Lysobacter enzymogenes TaxID=69 RepID=UPI0033965245
MSGHHKFLLHRSGLTFFRRSSPFHKKVVSKVPCGGRPSLRIAFAQAVALRRDLPCRAPAAARS